MIVQWLKKNISKTKNVTHDWLKTLKDKNVTHDSMTRC